jgi:predicted LPLAT superfamily acyltransferase
MNAQWTERKEIGNAAWLTFARFAGRRLGRRVTRTILYPVTLYFFFRRGPERRASRQYLERLRGRRVSCWSALRHIHCFSCTILDRLYLLSERFKRFDVRTFGLGELDRVLEGGQGVLLIGAHLGSFDALRVLSLERPEVKVCILLDTAQGERLTALLNTLNPALASSIINARGAGPAVVIKIKEALDRNAIVAVLADRGQPANPTLRANFLGHPAPFPTSPWLLAAALKVPVMLAFGLYRGGNRYDLHFELFAERIVIERARRTEAVGEILQRFADRLAHYAQLAPYNWFNFYDFWQEGTAGTPAHTVEPHAGDLVRRS